MAEMGLVLLVVAVVAAIVFVMRMDDDPTQWMSKATRRPRHAQPAVADVAGPAGQGTVPGQTAMGQTAMSETAED